MKVAILASNQMKIHQAVKKGTEIFVFELVKSLAERALAKKLDLDLTVFASGDSEVPAKVESIQFLASVEDNKVGLENHKIFELALVAKAFSKQSEYDMFHTNITNGEIILPFAQFVNKPILITLHGTHNSFAKKFYPLFKDLRNIYYVSISDSQRKALPNLNYVRTIYHGIDLKTAFKFSIKGSDQIMWAGRTIPDKGLDVVLEVIDLVKRKSKIYPILREEQLDWFRNEILPKRNQMNHEVNISMDFNIGRTELINQYQSSKLFLFPLQWEEPFGYVMIESIACGTPIVAYARGSVAEIIEDGESGFLVNPSVKDIRGKWITKKAGVEGLCEAIERIYAMPEEEYRNLRRSCRARAEKYFNVDRMADEYLQLYTNILGQNL